MKIKTMLELAFLEYYLYNFCWIGSFGFDCDGNIYERKRIKHD